IRDFLLEMAFRAERKIKKRTPVNTGNLRRNWRVGNVERRGNSYVVEIYNNTDYASFVEYGFRSHFVPGYWQGNHFVYDPSADTGMYVGPKDGWVEGRFMMTISMKEIERELPKYLEKRVIELLDNIMNGRPARKGGDGK
ncbi:MAG: HK97 gp10 family phage protein, partial [Clostridiaceae bacterium]|nr:HK97 gp10 family phage protein [Clostridiaceae bacterium]